MQTQFTDAQRAMPGIAEAEKILRKCVHCGMCTATCPTFNLLGDELDSPRGRIYLIKDMLENDRPADAPLVKHIDRCLSCLSCTTTCPSGVDYMHLVDHARAHIETTFKRPWQDRLLRRTLAALLPYPARFSAAMRFAALGKPLAPLLWRLGGSFRRLSAMLQLAPWRAPASSAFAGQEVIGPEEEAHSDQQKAAKKNGHHGRVILLQGCAQKALDPQINDRTIKLLTRLGYQVLQVKEEACCGSLVLHMGAKDKAQHQAANNIKAWQQAEALHGPVDAIIITASGCGTTVKDYEHLLAENEPLSDAACRYASISQDITEFLSLLDLPSSNQGRGIQVAYHSACSMQHGQKITHQPATLLQNAGFTLTQIAEGYMCCGSAGTYNILQPDLALQLRERKQGNIAKGAPDVVATGNLGCMTQLRQGASWPILHTVALLDWAYGGEKPSEL
ncbi:heterodisulfide reductase-related iron-sulfur binding cluster [Polycladidibacter hongkongensis]|uniref:heterodisulfide reductase-related iron-sulfur binding cluster n=1 Tax=Polycladidibacter hongkongensis TaxID=1647556 RepID=UPI000833189D|nr:heterodisulfide reductase-related iron-sulfur binding cluster [Pseudovibrio hongkongensis]